MKKILLMIQNINHYEERIINELNNQGYKVEVFDVLNPKYSKARKIKNPFLRLYNDKYLKKYKGINLKDKLEAEEILKDLKKLNYDYDIFLKIGCIYLSENVLKFIKSKVKICISHHWDSSIRMKKCNFELEKKYFNKISSYERDDVKNFDLKYLSNFYFYRNKNEIIEYDVYTLMSKNDESRENLLYKIAEKLLKEKFKINFILYSPNLTIKEKLGIRLTDKGISVIEMVKAESKSKAVLELCHSLNKGYTFRTFDCIGMRKKLITNNKDIINEDFYNPNNILIIDEKNINIPREFIDSPYEDLPEEIYKKYSLENWIKQLLDVK